MSDTVVIYFFVDPAYEPELNGLVNAIKDKGFRIVKGDNADELLFLLQVGRPTAIVYTLENSESRASAGFQMVSRRALSALVPMLLVGPGEPQEGAMLLYPVGSSFNERHVPFDALTRLVEHFFSEPPSTNSRPPDFVAKQTLGKGKFLPTWDGSDNEADEAAETAKLPQIDAQMVEIESELETREGDTKKIERFNTTQNFVHSMEKKIEKLPINAAHGARVSLEQEKSGAEIKKGDVNKTLATDENVPVPFESDLSDIDLKSDSPEKKAGRWKVIIAVLSVIVITTVGLLVFWVFHSVERKPVPSSPSEAGLQKTVTSINTDRLSIGVVAEEKDTEQPVVSHASPDESVTQPAEGSVAPLKKQQPTPVVEIDAAKDEDIGVLNKEISVDGGWKVIMPIRFRIDSAVFWFDVKAEEKQFLDLLEKHREKQIVLTGFISPREAAKEKPRLSMSRGWAIEKYLKRNGIRAEQITVKSAEVSTFPQAYKNIGLMEIVFLNP